MEDEKLYSGADKKIFSKLWQYGSPYLGKIMIIFILVLVLSGIQICLPLITKKVVDNYIERSHLKLIRNDKSIEITDKHKSYRIITDNIIFIPSNILNKEEYFQLEEDALIWPEKYILFKGDESVNQLKKYQLNITKTAQGVFIPYSEIQKISQDDIRILRYNDLKNVKLFALIYVGLLIFTFISP